MGTQISKGAGLLERQTASRELQTQLRRKHDDMLELQAQKGAESKAAIKKESSKVELAASGQSDTQRVNERQNGQAREKSGIEQAAILERRNQGSENSKNAVLEAYGLDDPLKIIALNKERTAGLAVEREIAIANQAKTTEVATELRKEQNLAFDQNLVEQQEKLRQVQNDFFDPRKIAAADELSILAEEAEAAAEEIEFNLKEEETALEIENKGKAR